MVNYDGTVRNSVGQLIQLRYGEDGLSPETVEFQSLPTIKLSNKAFEKKFKFDHSNDRYLRRIFNEDIAKELTNSAEVINEIEQEWEQLNRIAKLCAPSSPPARTKWCCRATCSA